VCAWRSQGGADECNGRREIGEHQLSAHTNYTVAKANELAITARIRCATAGVIAAVDLHDEPDTRHTEISDEALTDRHLPAKAHAKLTRVERRPQTSFRLRETAAMLLSKELEPSHGFRVG